MAPRPRFGPFELDPDREELKHSGLALRLTGQPFQILRLLVDRAGETVTREEIQAAVWGEETHVGVEQGINTAIRQIRMVLGDQAEAPRYVRTIPRRGYVFIAPVRWATDQRPRRSRMQAILALLFLSLLIGVRDRVPAARTIAVHPFRTIGASADGVDARAFEEELRAAIALLPARSVTLVTSPADRADVVIDGTVQRTASGLRVIVSGIDGRSHAQLWSETYERPNDWTDGVAIETAHRVAHVLAQRYLPPPRHAPVMLTNVRPRTRDLYSSGRAERHRDPERARRLFQTALVAEPRFAEAWSALADLWAERTLAASPRDRPAAARKAKEYAGRALQLQPRNAEALSALGVIALQYEYDLAAAAGALRSAVVCDPDYSDAHFNLAAASTARGQFDDALREYAIARQLDPVAFDLHPSEAQLYLHARRYDDSLARFRESLALNRDALSLLLGMLSVYVAQGRWPEAIELSQRIAAQSEIPKRGVPATAEGFRDVYRDLEPLILDGQRRGVFNDYTVAAYYAELGETEHALARLEGAIADRAPSVSYVLVDPRLDPLRGDPRFHALLRGTKLESTSQDLAKEPLIAPRIDDARRPLPVRLVLRRVPRSRAGAQRGVVHRIAVRDEEMEGAAGRPPLTMRFAQLDHRFAEANLRMLDPA